MQTKVLITSALATALMGVGVLAGSVVGANRAAAQAPAATPQPTTAPTAPKTTPPSSNNTTPSVPGMRGPGGMRGYGHGGFGGEGYGGPEGFGGFGGHGEKGFGGGMWGDGLTADGATQQITNTTNLLTSVKGDLTYATGKMDTTDVQRWLNGADSLLQNAQSANSKAQYGQSEAYSGAARQLASTAEMQMAQKLGADTLPSNANRPQWPNKQMPTAPVASTITQAQASRVLADAYNRLVEVGNQVKAASNAGEATPYLTDAQNAYKAAYSAYQAGNYNDAVTSARLAVSLGSVANEVARALTAPANSDTPVTVPAPTF